MRELQPIIKIESPRRCNRVRKSQCVIIVDTNLSWMCRRCTNQPFTLYFPSRSLNTAHIIPLLSYRATPLIYYNHRQFEIRELSGDVDAGEDEAEQLEAEEEEEVRL